MAFDLSPRQQRWLEARVAAARFASPNAAVVVPELSATAEDDPRWTDAAVDGATAERARGNDVPGDPARARIDPSGASR